MVHFEKLERLKALVRLPGPRLAYLHNTKQISLSLKKMNLMGV